VLEKKTDRTVPFAGKARIAKMTPIEKIFAKLVGRKMNAAERRYFHLKSKTQ
jgi:hypothetical protein